MDRDGTAIDKEYADLCIKFGDISQKLQHLEEQESIAEEKLHDEAEKVRLTFAQARGSLETDLIKIRNRWKELQVEVQSRLPQGE